MEFNELFGENESLTCEEFTRRVTEAEQAGKFKFVNLKNGGYVDVNKFKSMEDEFKRYKSETADYNDLKSKLEQLTAEMTAKQVTEALRSADVDERFDKFIISEIGEVKDFKKAVADYIKNNEQFKKKHTEPQQQGGGSFFAKGSSGVSLAGNSPKQNENDTINNFLRGI